MLARRNENYWQILLRRVVLLFIFVSLIFAIVFIFSDTFKNIAQSGSVPFTSNVMAIEKKTTSIGLPVRLKIPSINVDAEIYYVGLNFNGAMDIKNDPIKVAWYELGPRPGENGNAVIAGHYGWTGKKGSVFNDLHKLNKNDKIQIIDNLGIITTFIVREIQKYNPNADASNVFKSSDNRAHLNLITCDGVWVNSKKTYSNRLVVFADKE